MSNRIRLHPNFHCESLPRFFAIMLCMLMCAACSKSPSEALLRESIDQLQTLGESRDVGGMMDWLADDFSGQSGQMDRAQMRAYLMAIRLRTQNIGITRTKTEIAMDGDRAKVTIFMVVTDGGRALPSTGQIVEAQTQWRFVGGKWQLSSAIWKEGL